MYPKAAVDVSMLVPSISHAQIPNPVKCKIPSQSPGFSSFQPKNYPLNSTKTQINLILSKIVFSQIEKRNMQLAGSTLDGFLMDRSTSCVRPCRIGCVLHFRNVASASSLLFVRDV